MKKKICCFTGHRPQKLSVSEKSIKIRLKNAIEKAVEDGYLCFISGMAAGVDLWAAEIVLELKEKDGRVELICALPYPLPQSKITDKIGIPEKADRVVNVSDKYHRGCYQKRNEWMVDNSDMVIAAYEGRSGGTENTIRYAIKKNKVIIHIIHKC